MGSQKERGESDAGRQHWNYGKNLLGVAKIKLTGDIIFKGSPSQNNKTHQVNSCRATE